MTAEALSFSLLVQCKRNSLSEPISVYFSVRKVSKFYYTGETIKPAPTTLEVAADKLCFCARANFQLDQELPFTRIRGVVNHPFKSPCPLWH